MPQCIVPTVPTHSATQAAPIDQATRAAQGTGVDHAFMYFAFILSVALHGLVGLVLGMLWLSAPALFAPALFKPTTTVSPQPSSITVLPLVNTAAPSVDVPVYSNAQNNAQSNARNNTQSAIHSNAHAVDMIRSIAPTALAMPVEINTAANVTERLTVPAAIPAAIPAAAIAATLSANTSSNPSTTISASQTPIMMPSTAGGATHLELPTHHAAYLNNPTPPYPAQSRRLGEQGMVKWRVLIGADGKASEPEMVQSSGFTRLDEAAKLAVLSWRYVPGKVGGAPQAMRHVIPLTYSQP